MNLFEWVKNNKLTFILLLVIVYFVFLRDRHLLYGLIPQIGSRSYSSFEAMDSGYGEAEGVAYKSVSRPSIGGAPAAPTPEVSDRMVQETSNISMVVDSVRQSLDAVLNHVSGIGGYMVSSSLNQPEEAPFATLIVRVPQPELRSTLEYLRGMAVKVTSENLLGRDVTDEYLDLEARLGTLNKTKAKFEEILEIATEVDDILRVQREIINLQSQIDSLKGQQLYLQKTSETAKLTVYLSTDEWALPYTPSEPSFRPNVIFKQAVRSLVKTLRGLAKLAIWLGVYSIVWLPALIIFIWWRRRRPPVVK